MSFKYDVLLVDDNRVFNEKVRSENDKKGNRVWVAKNSLSALGFLSRIWTEQQCHYGLPLTELWLDHDLGPGDDIVPVIDFLTCIEPKIEFEKIYLHTMNPPGALMMYRALRRRYNNGVMGYETNLGSIQVTKYFTESP